MDPAIETLLGQIEAIKEKITDNEYKILLESLSRTHIKQGSDKIKYELDIRYITFQQSPFNHAADYCEANHVEGGVCESVEDCPFIKEVYCIKPVFLNKKCTFSIPKEDNFNQDIYHLRAGVKEDIKDLAVIADYLSATEGCEEFLFTIAEGGFMEKMNLISDKVETEYVIVPTFCSFKLRVVEA